MYKQAWSSRIQAYEITDQNDEPVGYAWFEYRANQIVAVLNKDAQSQDEEPEDNDPQESPPSEIGGRPADLYERYLGPSYRSGHYADE